MTDVQRCGAINPRDQKPCALERGHAKLHYAGAGFHWNDSQPTKATKPTKKPAPAKKVKPAKVAPPQSDDDARIEAEIEREAEEDVQREIAKPSRAEERMKSGESVLVSELLAAREAKRRKKAAKKAERSASPNDEESDEQCNAVALHDDEWICVHPKGHDGTHQSERVPGGTVAMWTTEPDGSELGELRAVNHKGKVMSTIAVGSGGWARPSDQDRDAAKKRSLTDLCAKCGRELGEHDGKKCPKQYGYVLRTRAHELLCDDGEFRDSDHVGAGVNRAKVYKTKAAASAAALHVPRVIDIVPWFGAPDRKPAVPIVPIADELILAGLAPESNTVGLTEPVSVGYQVRGEGDRRILGYRRHAAAALFELLEGEPLEQLAESIATNGQRDPIVLVTVGGETFILDGSNRGIACEMRGIKPKITHYEGPKDMESLIAYSMDKNKHRRHQEPSVLAMVAVDAGQLLGRGNPGDRETGRSAGLMTQAEAGKRLGVSERLIRKAKVVKDKGTAKLNEAVRKGKLAVDAAEQVTKLPEAKQDVIADEALAKKSGAVRGGRVRALVRQEEKRDVVRKINEQRVAPMPLGPFGVIYGDYPWLFDNSDQHEGSRGHMGYPPMTLDEIIAHALETRSRATENCVLALWVPNWHIVEWMKPVLEAYGAIHRTVWTWPKPHFGVGTWGRGQTEHLVIASIGEPTHTLNEVSTLLPPYVLREHSRKPDEVAALLLKHCAGPHLELFGREPREGFAVWGAEPRKFASEAA